VGEEEGWRWSGKKTHQQPSKNKKRGRGGKKGD